jgi:hypothetical protein
MLYFLWVFGPFLLCFFTIFSVFLFFEFNNRLGIWLVLLALILSGVSGTTLHYFFKTIHKSCTAQIALTEKRHVTCNLPASFKDGKFVEFIVPTKEKASE